MPQVGDPDWRQILMTLSQAQMAEQTPPEARAMSAMDPMQSGLLAALSGGVDFPGPNEIRRIDRRSPQRRARDAAEEAARRHAEEEFMRRQNAWGPMDFLYGRKLIPRPGAPYVDPFPQQPNDPRAAAAAKKHDGSPESIGAYEQKMSPEGGRFYRTVDQNGQIIEYDKTLGRYSTPEEIARRGKR